MEHSSASLDINSLDTNSQDINDSIVTKRILSITQGAEARILVVEDDELTLALISDLLRSSGFEVRQASDGAQALKILDQEWFPVIITDNVGLSSGRT